MTRTRSTVYLWLATAVLILAAAARLYNLTRLDFWIDEDWTVWFSVLDASLADTLTRLSADVHPPLYFLAVNLWTHFAGISEQSIRLLSVWPSLLAVALTIRLGREWFGRTGGVLSGLVLAVSMYHVWFAQEARHYPVLTMFAALSMLLYTHWLRQPTRRHALWWIIANALMLWTHYLGLFVIVTEGAHLLLYGRKQLRQAAVMLFVVVLLFAPWVPVFIEQVGGGASHGAGGLGQTIPTTMENIWAQFRYLSSEQPALYLLLLAIAAWGTWTVWRPSPLNLGKQPWRPIFPTDSAGRGSGGEGLALAWLWALLPLTLLFAVNFVFRLYNTRNALLVAPGFALVIGFALAWLFEAARRGVQLNAPTPETGRGRGNRVMRLVPFAFTAAVLLLSPLVTQLHRPAITDEKPVRSIYQVIAANDQPGDVIFIDPDCFSCYNPHEWEYYERLLIGHSVPIYRWDVTENGDPTGLLHITGDWPRPGAATESLTLPPRVWYVSDLRDRSAETLAWITTDRRQLTAGGIYELTVQLLVTPPGPHFLFGEDQAVHLRGAEFPATAAPGEPVQVRLWWLTDHPLDADYSVSVRLAGEVGADGPPLAQHDAGPSELYQGQVYEWPTSGWAAGDFILDDHFLTIPPDLAPGNYALQVVFYQWWDDTRWPAFDASGAPVGNSVTVGTLTVTPSQGD